MAETTLSLPQLNRTLLDRQLLLRRHQMEPVTAIERLFALQSQIPNPPYIGLWSRLQAFDRQDLTRLLETREIARAPWIRSTLHLISASDHQRFQAVIQPALARGLRAFFGKRAKDLDVERLCDIARPFLEHEEPTIGALRAHLQEHEPSHDAEAMAYAVRSYLPLVQVPPSGAWGAGTRATYTTAAYWLGEARPLDLTALFRRYLSAFGPASVMDFQTWSGMTGLKSQLAADMRNLVRYRSESGETLYDLPGLPIGKGEDATPLRFLPEYDNILIAHKDRRRILPETHRKKVFASAGRVLSTVLIDGFVAGIWKARKTKVAANLRVSLFERQSTAVHKQIQDEGQRLIRFIEDGAQDCQVDIEVED